MNLHLLAITCLLGTLVGLAQGQASEDSAEAESRPAGPAVDFNRDVKPILARRCFACHGPGDAEGGLQLHQHTTALAELDSGNFAIVPGQPDMSELLARITADDETRMPPEGEPLSTREIERIRRWIDQGASWKKHWAFQPVKEQTPPEVADREWVRTPIDAFLLHRLEQNGLPPAPPADKWSLLRRAYYNLTGLPPTPDEVDEFLADDSPEAFERVVDRLLESPHYGERWGRHWLDVVRFAETNSFERDGRKPHAWRYRDYVIRSLNDDKPYDQFIREQLAGDELPEVTPDTIIATGFYRLGLWDDEPADRLQAKYDGLDDILATTSEAFLGLTVACARCHDHKIDPIPQQDYYSLLAFFHGVTPMGNGGPQIERLIFEDEQARRKYDAEVRALEQRRNDVQARLTALEDKFRQQANLTGVQPDLDELKYQFYRDTFTRLPDFDNLKPETVAKLDKPFFDIRPATREDDFGFVFTGVLKVPQDGDYTFLLDSDDGSRLSINGKTIIEYDGIHGVGNPKKATVSLTQGRLPIRLDYFQGKHGKGLSVTWSGPGFKTRYLSATTADGTDIADLKGKPLAELIKNLGEPVLGRENFQQYNQLQQNLEKLKREQVPADYALCVTEVGPRSPDTFLFQRGNPHVRGEQVEPAFPGIFESARPQIPAADPGAKTSGRRRVLADWIASPDNMLTARVMVNRVWQHHFGRGLVRSPNNFGELGQPPTHPELLDWLASEFVREGWRLKPLHKLIVMSQAYQMSARGSSEALAQDPNNDLFWRFNMRRLSAEEIRDSVHAVNGRLNAKMYGPGFFPEISAEVLAGQSRPGAGWGKSDPDEQARRSIYIHVKRSLITPILASFDFPETDTSCEARFATTQPGQALGMLNGSFLHEQAERFAQRVRREAGAGREQQVRMALRLALGYSSRLGETRLQVGNPARLGETRLQVGDSARLGETRLQEAEVQRGLALLDRLEREHGVDPDAALKFYCLVVLNLNEFIYLD